MKMQAHDVDVAESDVEKSGPETSRAGAEQDQAQKLSRQEVDQENFHQLVDNSLMTTSRKRFWRRRS
jgi:hypothetical protein